MTLSIHWMLAAVLAAVLALGALRPLSRKLLYFPQPLAPGRAKMLENRVFENQVPESPEPGITPLTVTATDGTRLAGWCIEKDTVALPFIFYFGGNAEEVSLNIEAFLALPANVVLVNYRGYGESRGKPTEDHLKADSLVLFDIILKKYRLNPGRCLAWGRSLGSSVASYLAYQRRLGGLILTCPFDSIEAVAAGFYPAWLVRLALADRHNTLEFSPAITSPVLILAAEQDEIIPFERTKALAESFTCPVQLEVIRGAGHNTISEARGYDEAVREFILTKI